ncbi:hypothetical protein Bca4012_010263 [Brassica carinata]
MYLYFKRSIFFCWSYLLFLPSLFRFVLLDHDHPHPQSLCFYFSTNLTSTLCLSTTLFSIRFREDVTTSRSDLRCGKDDDKLSYLLYLVIMFCGVSIRDL